MLKRLALAATVAAVLSSCSNPIIEDPRSYRLTFKKNEIVTLIEKPMEEWRTDTHSFAMALIVKAGYVERNGKLSYYNGFDGLLWASEIPWGRMERYDDTQNIYWPNPKRNDVYRHVFELRALEFRAAIRAETYVVNVSNQKIQVYLRLIPEGMFTRYFEKY